MKRYVADVLLRYEVEAESAAAAKRIRQRLVGSTHITRHADADGVAVLKGAKGANAVRRKDRTQ